MNRMALFSPNRHERRDYRLATMLAGVHAQTYPQFVWINQNPMRGDELREYGVAGGNLCAQVGQAMSGPADPVRSG
jgi:hypothetical protein